jgi:hypothetical protein
MRTFGAGSTAHRTPKPAPPRAASAQNKLLVVVLLACACSGRVDRARPPRPTPDRPTGCIDTPHIGGDPNATTTGIRCGARPHTGETVLLQGRVTTQVDGGLPGPGVEGLWVGVHPFGGGPARAETKTGPQGEFHLSFVGSGEYLVSVRAEASGPVLAARRVSANAGERSEPVNLQVPP